MKRVNWTSTVTNELKIIHSERHIMCCTYRKLRLFWYYDFLHYICILKFHISKTNLKAPKSDLTSHTKNLRVQASPCPHFFLCWQVLLHIIGMSIFNSLQNMVSYFLSKQTKSIHTISKPSETMNNIPNNYWYSI